MEGILFSELDKYVIEKDSLSLSESVDKWHVVPYECGDFSGRLLLSGERSKPCDISIRTGLSGWHKIFIGTVNMKSKDLFNLKLSSDESFSAMTSPTMEHKFSWTPTEYFEEFLWRCADLTGEELILRKPECMWNNASVLAFLRCVPMTEEEIDSYLNFKSNYTVHGHFDEDPNGEDGLISSPDILTRYGQLTGGEIKEMSLEFSFDYDTENKRVTPILYHDDGWRQGDANFISAKEKAYKARVDYLHSKGIKVYAANRMAVSEFFTPYSNPHWTYRRFVSEHPELYCKTRTGRVVKTCSYAYPEVRRYVIDRFCEMMRYDFDGVTLILHRGQHIGFEEPVVEQFSRLYPGIDPRRLPLSDERLTGVLTSFMTSFMRELRKALDEVREGLLINVITDYLPESSRSFGIDVAEWARLGLCDRVMQGIMETREEVSDCLDENGLINLDLYEEKLKSEPIIKRFHDTSLERALDGSKKYLNALSGTNTTYYATLPWPHRCPYSEYEGYKEALSELGITDYLSWNTNHTLLDVAEMHALLGRDKEFYTVNRYRTLSLDGVDMSEFNPNWRG